MVRKTKKPSRNLNATSDYDSTGTTSPSPPREKRPTPLYTSTPYVHGSRNVLSSYEKSSGSAATASANNSTVSTNRSRNLSSQVQLQQRQPQPIAKKSKPKGKTFQQSDKITKKKRFRPGTVALREIRKQQMSWNLLIPKRAFARVVREILQHLESTYFAFSRTTYRWTTSAILALQEAAESYMINFFEDSQLLAIHAKRITVMQRDMFLVRRLRRETFW